MQLAEHKSDSEVRIMIADNHSIFMDGIERIVQELPNFKVIAKAVDGTEILRALNSNSPDLLLLDIFMPVMGGMETAIAVRKKLPSVKIIFISHQISSTIRVFIKQHKINGFVIKDANSVALQNALIQVMDGRTIIIGPPKSKLPAVKPTLAEERSETSHNLTPTEITIIKELAKGLSTKMIAGKLSRTYFTIDTHRKNINKKTGCKNIAELIAYARKMGLLDE